MLETTVVETWKQNVGIRTTIVEMVIAPIVDVVRRGVLIGYATKLGSGSGGVSTGRKLNGNLTLPTTTTGVGGTPQMVFTNRIMTTRVNRTVD
jgi:hypothetical protein